jgi:four helix bundle protein
MNSENIRNYRDLVVWQKSMLLVEMIYKATQNFPDHELYGLTNQIRRASVSIPSNIAEGHARQSRAEFRNFISISQGSRSEVETQIMIAQRLNYISETEIEASALEDAAINLINDHIQEQQKKKIPPLIKPVSGAVPGVQDKEKNEEIKKPAPYVKPITTIDPSDIYLEKTNKFIETEQEIDDYLEQLKKTLLNAIKEGSRIRIR